MPVKLTVSGLSKRFDALEALRGIDLAVDRGEFIALVGPSGCGKTTFLRIFAGLEPAPSGGVLRGFPAPLRVGELFSALEAQTGEIMQTELLRIWDQGRKAVLFVTHQIDEAVFLSDRVLVCARRPGRVQENVTVTLPRPREL